MAYDGGLPVNVHVVKIMHFSALLEFLYNIDNLSRLQCCAKCLQKALLKACF